MKKIICCFVLVVVLVFAMAAIALGYNTAHIVVDTQQFGEITIYVPINYIDGFFSFNDAGHLVNVSASTITGYFDYGGTRYSCRWSSFGTAEYRYVSGGYYVDWEALRITEYSYTNLVEPDVTEVPNISVLVYIVIACLLCIVLVLLMRKGGI